MSIVAAEPGSQVRVEPRPELDGLTPVDVAERLRTLGALAVLESARAGRNARWSYVSADPIVVVDRPSDGPSPFADARRVLRRLYAGTRSDASAPPFIGGLIGHLSYDLGRRFEWIPEVARDDQRLPLMRLQLHDWVLAHDRRTGRWWLGGRAVDGDAERLDARFVAVREAMQRDAPPPDADSADSADGAAAGSQADVPALEFRSGMDRRAFEAGVEAIRAAVGRGTIYQANLTRRLEAPFAGDPWAMYRLLRTGDPALFAAFLPLDDSGRKAIVSASPEPFLSLNTHGIVASDPIKGTRPRGRDPEDDHRLARELLASEKDRAENTMIVDVLRNDIGRISVPGSVMVPRLLRLERTAAVQHLVSTVTGRIRPGLDPFDVLAAAFPGGSITGAPKIRAMQLIERLEPFRRGPYTGTAGWIGPDGTMQTSILIRTFIADGTRLTVHVGGGITWRSDAAAEWDETVDKARGPLSAIGGREIA